MSFKCEIAVTVLLPDLMTDGDANEACAWTLWLFMEGRVGYTCTPTLLCGLRAPVRPNMQ